MDLNLISHGKFNRKSVLDTETEVLLQHAPRTRPPKFSVASEQTHCLGRTLYSSGRVPVNV